MKFIHMADMHFDAPFTVLNIKNNLGEKRRLEQREIFKKVINYIKENNIEYLFISGDLYENEYVKESTITYINNLFKEIPNTKIYISPGNHDPYIINSMYKNFDWNNNVRIFENKVECIENEDIDIYGFGFNDFYCKGINLDNINIKNKEKINIFITHGTIDGGNTENLEYNPLNKNKLKELNFDYVALGHIHKLNYNEEPNQKIVYPGSTISMGFDEQGKHGVILGDISKDSLKLEFLPMDTKEFVEKEIDITDINSTEELIEKLNEMNLLENNYYKINLIGKRNFEINCYYLYKFILKENIIKIKDKTEINYNIEKISEENNLKGLFIKEILEDEKNNILEKNIAEKIIEIGLEILK